MTRTLYRKRFEGHTYIGLVIDDGLSIEVLRGRKAKHQLRSVAREYGIIKIRRGLNKGK